LFVVSLVGVGLYLLIPRLTEEPPSQTQKQATPSAKQKEHPLKNKIIFTKDVFVSLKDTPQGSLITSDYDIYAIKPNGNDETRILDFKPSESTWPFELSISSNGKYLGWLLWNKNYFQYVSSDSLERPSIFTVKPSHDKGIIEVFDFSPDETKAALLETYNLDTQGFGTSMLLRIINLSNNQQVKEVKLISGGGSSDERLSPKKHINWVNSSTIAAVTKQDDKYSISSFNLVSGAKKNIATFDYFPDSFVVDTEGKKLFFWKNKGDDKELWVSDLDRNNVKKLVNLVGVPRSTIHDMKISPNKKFLAYNWLVFETRTMVVLNLASNKEVLRLQGDIFDWGPDNNRLVVLNFAPPSSVTNLLVVGLDGKEITKLTNEGKTNRGIPYQDFSYQSVAWFPK
jgi:hypothetical protein